MIPELHPAVVAAGPTVVRPLADPHMDPETYDPEGDLMILNLGPQHPSTHGVFRVKLWLDGEVCIKAVPYPGYLHRGVEKLCEKLSYVMLPPIVDKNDYVSPFINELALNLGFEALNDVQPPRRAWHLGGRRWERQALPMQAAFAFLPRHVADSLPCSW